MYGTRALRGQAAYRENLRKAQKEGVPKQSVGLHGMPRLFNTQKYEEPGNIASVRAGKEGLPCVAGRFGVQAHVSWRIPRNMSDTF